MTQREKMAKVLTHIGWVQDKLKGWKATDRTWTFRNPKNPEDGLYLGRYGSLRRGRVKSQSVAVFEGTKKNLLTKYEVLFGNIESVTSEGEGGLVGDPNG